MSEFDKELEKYSPFFIDMGTDTQVMCSADRSKCRFRLNVNTSSITGITLCTHENAPLPSEDTDILYRRCMTPQRNYRRNS